MNHFVLDTPLEGKPNSVNALVTGFPNPTVLYKLLTNGLQHERPEFINRREPVQIDKGTYCSFEAVNLRRRFTILYVVPVCMTHERQHQFVDGKSGSVIGRFISWKSSTFGVYKRINLDASSVLCNQLTVKNPGRLRTIFTQKIILPMDSDASLSTLFVEKIRRKNIRFSCYVRGSFSFRGRTSTIEVEFSPH